MSCTSIHDQLPQSAKWGSLSGDAFRLGIVALCWAREERNLRKRPGFIPTGMLSALSRRTGRAAKALAQELVAAGKPLHEVGIWVDTEGGWMIHDFGDYGPTEGEGNDPVSGASTVAVAEVAVQGQTNTVRTTAARIAGLASAEARRSRNGSAQPERLPNVPERIVRTTPERPRTNRSNDSRTSPNESFERLPNAAGSNLLDSSQDPKISDPEIPKESVEDLKTCQVLAREQPNADPPNDSRTSPNESLPIVVLSNLEEALKSPIGPRAQAAQQNKYMADFSEVQRWPEVMAVANKLAEVAQCPAYAKLGTSYAGDFGLQAVVALFAAGFSQEDIEKAVTFTVHSDWWTKPGANRGLSSFSLEVVRRALAAASGKPRPTRTVRKAETRTLEEQGFVPAPSDVRETFKIPAGATGPEAVAAILDAISGVVT